MRGNVVGIVAAGILLVALVVAAWWFAGSATEVPSIDAPQAAPGAMPGAGLARGEPGPSADGVPQRTGIGSTADLPGFESVDEDGEPIADAVRDGLVVELRAASGPPIANCRLALHWRKGFGLYGQDRGVTGADGKFATTVGNVMFVEELVVRHPEFGTLLHSDVPLPAAHDPKRVVYVVPSFATVQVAVRDRLGQRVEGAQIVVRSHPAPAGAREAVLEAHIEDATTDAEGVARLRLPVGACELTAQIGDDKPVQSVEIAVLPEGGTGELVVLRPEHRVTTEIEVVLPSGAGGIDYANAWANAPLPQPTSPLVVAVEDRQRDFTLRSAGPGRYVVNADPMPWRFAVRAKGCAPFATEVAPGQPTLRVVLSPVGAEPPQAEPMALLRVLVQQPDGTPARHAQVRVHETPDLVYGSDVAANRDGRCEIRRKAGGRVCVSARAPGFALSVVGPIELTPGVHDIEVNVQAAGTVTGIVLGADGEPIRADVCLRRPAGALRALADGVPEMLNSSASGDSLMTGEPGRFHFNEVGVGEHEIWAFPQVGGWPARKRVRAGDDVTLRPGDGNEGLVLVTLRLLDDSSGELLTSSMVRVDGALYTPRRAGPAEPFTFVARAGELVVRAVALDHVVTTTKIQVATSMSVDVRLPRSVVRFVRVLDVAGRPVRDAEVAAVDAAGTEFELVDAYGRENDTTAETDRAGRVVLRGLPDGALTLVVKVPGGKHRFELPADAGKDAPFDLRLGR